MTDLRAIAEAATPGPWGTRKVGPVSGLADPMTAGDVAITSEALLNESGVGNPFIGEVWAERVRLKPDPAQAAADAAHIAAWSPDRAISALDVIEAARAFTNGDGSLRPYMALEAALARWKALR